MTRAPAGAGRWRVAPPRLLRALLAAVAAALAAAAIGGSVLLARQEAVLSEAASFNVPWAAAQTSAEWLRLKDAIGSLGPDPSPADLRRLDVRARVARSRIADVATGRMHGVVQRAPDLAWLVEGMERTVDAAEAVARGGDRSGIEALIADVARVGKGLVTLASAVHVASIDDYADAQVRLSTLLWAFQAIALATVLIGLALLTLLASHNRRLRAAEEARRQSEERMGLAMDAAGAGWWSRSGGAISASPKAREIVGVDADAGALALDGVLANIEEADRTRLRNLSEQGSYRYSVRIDHPRLGTRWITLMGRVRDPGAGAGADRFSHGIVIDETERKELEDELTRAKETAEGAVAAKSRMLVATSHDLRQPLQSMFLMAAAAEAEADPARRAAHMALLQEGMTTLKSLLDGIVEVARIETGAVEAKVGDFPLGQLLDEIEGAYAARAAAKGLSFRVGRGADACVRSDRVLLGRMLRNLVENALRYTDRGGVEIASAWAGDGGVRIEVRDTGRGIAPEHLHLVWEEFHQVGNPERDRSEGLGLGLAIVRMLGRTLGHKLEVTSEPGAGSTFSIRVPPGAARAPAPAAPAVPAPSRPAASPGRTVVVIDDDPLLLGALGASLGGVGFAVLSAPSGREAADAVRRADAVPDCVLADYRLRDGETGPQAVARVREAVGRDVPALILTGEVGEEAQRDAEGSGLPMLRKPVTARALVEGIESLARRPAA